MYCRQCGAQNPDGSTRCFACGAEIVSVSQVPVNGKTSGLATAALILGILAFFTGGITALPAIICGIIALVKISGSGGLLKGTGMAVAGIVISSMIPAIAIILAILMPALSQVRHMAQRVVCVQNMQGLAIAMIVYANDYDDKVPTADKWCDLLMQEVDVSAKTFHCPAAELGTCSYALNKNLKTLETFDARIVAIFESRPGWNQAGGPELLTTDYHQGRGCNVAFAGGYAQFIRTEDLHTLKWTHDE